MVSTLQKLLRSTSLNSDDPNPPSQPRLSEAGSANLLKQSSLPSRGEQRGAPSWHELWLRFSFWQGLLKVPDRTAGSFNDFSVGCGEDAQGEPIS